MSTVTIWFNRNIASTFNVLESIRSALRPGEDWRLVASHPYHYSAVFAVAARHEIEPGNLKDDAYVRWCLDFARRHQVNLFWPGTRLRAIVQRGHEFEALGVRIISVGDTETLRMLESKSRLYQDIPPGLAPIPEYRVAHDLAQFDAAYEELRARHRIVCFKPCVSVYGLGFRIISPRGGGAQRLLNTASLKIGIDQARRMLGAEVFRPLIVMPYLPGPERSVDCLARDGELLRAVVRRKASAEGYQKLEDNPGIVEIAARLTRHFRLDAVFNVQFRDADGQPYLLEINPRMSGGLYCACLSGLEFPYWAIRLALGTINPGDIPHPEVGFRVAQVNRAIRL